MAGRDILQYINDHAAAGSCLYAHYQGQHDDTRCTLPAGYCAVIAYSAALLNLSETRSQGNYDQQQYAPAPPSYVPPANGTPANGIRNETPAVGFPEVPAEAGGTGGSHALDSGNAGGNGYAYSVGSGSGGGGAGSSNYWPNGGPA